jgi:hypothetical protein
MGWCVWCQNIFATLERVERKMEKTKNSLQNSEFACVFFYNTKICSSIDIRKKMTKKRGYKSPPSSFCLTLPEPKSPIFFSGFGFYPKKIVPVS